MIKYILIYDDEFGFRNVEFCKSKKEVKNILKNEGITSTEDLEETCDESRTFEVYSLSEPVKKIEEGDIEDFI